MTQETVSPVTDTASGLNGAGQVLAVRLISSFFVGVLLIIPLRGALATTTFLAQNLWILGAVAGVVLLAVLLRRFLPRGGSLVVATAGVYSVVVLIVLAILAALGDPGTVNVTALLAGLPSAVLSAFAATVLIGHLDGTETNAGSYNTRAISVGLCVVGALVAMAAGPEIGRDLDQAREDAELIQALEEFDLTPVLPEIPGLEALFAGAVHDPENRTVVTGYLLRFEADEDEFDDPGAVLVEVALPDGPECADSGRCHEGDGYVYDTATEKISAGTTVSEARLTATIDDPTGTPNVNEIGQALSEAEEVDWSDVVGLEHY